MLYYKVMARSGKPLAGENVQINISSLSYIINKYNLTAVNRNQYIVMPRQYLMWWLRINTKMSLSAIGSLFDGKDHATVLHAYNTIENAFDTKDAYVSSVIYDIDKWLKERYPDKKHSKLPVFDEIDMSLDCKELYYKYRVSPRKLSLSKGIKESIIRNEML